MDIDNEMVEIADGSISRLLDNIDDSKTGEFKKLVSHFYSNDLANIEKILTGMNKLKTKNKSELPVYLKFLKTSTKDLFLLNLKQDNTSISYEFLKERYISIIKLFPNADWPKIINQIDDCLINISKNINLSLEIYSLMINVQSCLLGKSINTLDKQIDVGI